MNTFRPYRLQVNDSLDRRRLEELFLWAAGRFAEINQWALGDAVFGRNMFDDHAWEEYRFTSGLVGAYRIPTHGHLIAGCFLRVNHSEEYYEGKIGWSISVTPKTSACKQITAWPVCGTALLVGGHDSVDCDQKVKYATPVAADPAPDPSNKSLDVAASAISDAYNFTLGGLASFSGVLSSSVVGVMTYGSGIYEVTKVAIGHRKVLR